MALLPFSYQSIILTKGSHLKILNKYLKAFNPDQKRVIYAYLCALTIGLFCGILSFGLGATLVLFLSPVIKVHFARPNTADVIETHDGKILTIDNYAGYFKLWNILTPCLIFGLFVLIAVCFDYDIFGFLAFLLILGYYAALSAYMIQHKLPLLSAKRGYSRETDSPPPPNFRCMKDDEISRISYDAKYSNMPGNIFNDAYRPKSHL